MNMTERISKTDAIAYLGISDKDFKNYHESSQEIVGEKINGRWFFDKDMLERWKSLKEQRTILLPIEEYQKCFQFAIKMVYGGLSLNGIRGQRTEVQAADDVILGILTEHAVKRFLKNKFNTEILLDEEVHPEQITPQDVDQIKEGEIFRKPKLGVGIKASKMKNAFLVLGGNEVDFPERRSDVYIFVRVGLPSDHLFRILRDHSFFKEVREYMESDSKFRKIEVLDPIPLWICGFVYEQELEKVTSIPGQEFTNGHRYAKSVKFMHNNDQDWRDLISKL